MFQAWTARKSDAVLTRAKLEASRLVVVTTTKLAHLENQRQTVSKKLADLVSLVCVFCDVLFYFILLRKL